MALKALSGLDAGFLYIETPETLMHVGSLCSFERPADLRGSFLPRVRKHIAGRMHLAPIFTRRLALMPLDLGHPVWVEAGKVELEYHIQGARLPKPGSERQLEALVAKLHAQPLDRERPLWQFTVIEGLADGQVALYSKVHHAALDGQAGVALAQAILDLGPVPREVPPPHEAHRARAPSRRLMLGTLFSNSLAQYVKLVRSVPSAVRAAAGAAVSLTDRIVAKRGLPDDLMAPRTRFNTQIGAARAFATCTLPLRDFKAVAAACEATINDLLLATCSGALRQYLAGHHELPKRSLVAAVPLSLRESGDSAAGNQVTMLPCGLGTDQKTPRARLAAIQAGMDKVKGTKSSFRDLIPTDYPSLGSPWLMSGLAQLYARTRLADRIPLPANLVISNVPGPPVTLYLAGARMTTYFPVSIVVHGLALNITVHSYDGNLHLGLIACRKNVPDLPKLVAALYESFDELKAMAASELSTATPRPGARPAGKRRKPR
jgi:diacylglycerol O-acyltransferase / wax synthase